MIWIALVTFLLVLLVLMASFSVLFSWIFFLTVIGQVLLVIMVYKVLKDPYKTDKTFEDFYEDYPRRS